MQANTLVLIILVSKSSCLLINQIYSVNLQRLIESGRDVYLRGTESRGGIGLAYVSHRHRHLSVNCRTVPSGGLLNVSHWDDRVGEEKLQTVRSPGRWKLSILSALCHYHNKVATTFVNKPSSAGCL